MLTEFAPVKSDTILGRRANMKAFNTVQYRNNSLGDDVDKYYCFVVSAYFNPYPPGIRYANATFIGSRHTKARLKPKALYRIRVIPKP